MSRRAEGSEQVSRPAEGWVEPGVIRQAGNAATVPASVMVTIRLPQGAPLTTGSLGQPGLPNARTAGGPRPWSDFRPALLLGYCCHRTLRRSGR